MNERMVIFVKDFLYIVTTYLSLVLDYSDQVSKFGLSHEKGQ